MKFDIIVDNWNFSPKVQGYAIQTYLTEVQHHHRVALRNGTLAENGNTTRTMQFVSDEYNTPVAYCEWTKFANIYNDTDDLINTIEVGTAYFGTLATPPPEAPGFAEGLAHLFLTYPNYGDGNKMIHDPSVGINDESFTKAIPVYVFQIIAGLLTLTASIIIIKRSKQ